METTLIILFTIIIILSIISMLYIILYNKIQFSKIRVEESEKVIHGLIEKRFNLIFDCKNTIEKNTKKDLSIFDELEKYKERKTDSIKLDKKVTEAINTIYIIKQDYPKIEEKKDFKETLIKLNETDEVINAAKSYYNTNNKILETTIKKFPANIIAIIHKVKVNGYYEAKEIFNEADDGIKI